MSPQTGLIPSRRSRGTGGGGRSWCFSLDCLLLPEYMGLIIKVSSIALGFLGHVVMISAQHFCSILSAHYGRRP